MKEFLKEMTWPNVILALGCLAFAGWLYYDMYQARVENPCESTITAQELGCEDTRTISHFTFTAVDPDRPYPCCSCIHQERVVYFSPREEMNSYFDGMLTTWRE